MCEGSYPSVFAFSLFFYLGLGGPSPDPPPPPSIRSPPKTMVFPFDLARFFQLAWGGYFSCGVPKTLSPILEHPKPSKTTENSIFSAQNPSKTSCNLPRALWKHQRASWSRPTGFWRTLRRPGARARGVRPASKLVPGDFWRPKTIKNQ